MSEPPARGACRGENSLSSRADYEDLEVLARDVEEKFNSASARIKQLEARLSELSGLRTHIINYSKTRDVYAAYRKSKNKKITVTDTRTR